MRNLLASLFLLFSLQVWADFPFEQYDLTEEQVQLIERLIDRGLDIELLHRLAQNMERQNNPAPGPYIPPHTWDELMEVVAWAEGGAFASFAHYAEVEFDGKRYWEDCPNPALFNFGRATGTEHLRVDVLSRALSTSSGLQIYYARHRENFREIYLDWIGKTPFVEYLVID